jgi:hypothetical protein
MLAKDFPQRTLPVWLPTEISVALFYFGAVTVYRNSEDGNYAPFAYYTQ